jgi:hypothetical protein
MRAFVCHRLAATLLVAIAGAIMPASSRADNPAAPQLRPSDTDPAIPKSGVSAFRTLVRGLVEKEVLNTGLPADIADAVVHVESNYDPSTIGAVGEIGLMQIRPDTAAMLGFKGSNDELAKPEINIHYGVIYLSKAWRLADGDLCRALMKYRAGHGEEIMTPRSVTYCLRARSHLAALGSPFAAGGTATAMIVPAVMAASASADHPARPESDSPRLAIASPAEVYTRYRRGTPSASRAFWAAHEARVHAITARIESRWRRVASR